MKTLRAFFIKDGKENKIHSCTEQIVQTLRSNLNYPSKDIEKEIAAIYERKEVFAIIYRKKKTEEA